MCGIAGIINSDLDLRNETKLVQNMADSLKMRGPDDEGQYISQNTILIHRRLSVIDVENGAQPMRFGKYIIVYNGEIYNTDEVRNELKSFGYEFETHCDTEVVLKAFDKWKEDSVKKLNGIFAYAVLNEENGNLFLTRDRIGVKPLFYSQKGNKFAFASRIKTLLCIPWIDSVVDENGLNEVFMLGPAKTIGNGVFRDISELPPAYSMTVKNGEIKIFPYWKLEAKEHTENESETIEHTYYLVKDAIERQMVSDVPLATFLSGGLDSSIISKVASDYYAKNGETLTTYSVDYIDNDKYFKRSLFQPNKDSDYIGLISQYVNSNHRNIILDNEDVAKALIESTSARCLPGFTDVDSSLLLFCKEVKKDFTVCLSGECADEIFGGYPWYHRKEILFEETFPWSRSVDVRQSILKDGFLDSGADYVREKYLNTVARTSHLDGESALESRMREMFILNLDWFMQTLLTRKDNMSMESSLEVRVPFCDYRIVEYAYNMPWSIKSADNREKGVLRKAFENDLPAEIAWRKKSPYPKTHNPIYFAAVCKMAKEVLADKTSPLAEMLNQNAIFELMEKPESLKEPWYGQLMRTPQIMAYIVQIYYWIKEYNVKFEY